MTRIRKSRVSNVAKPKSDLSRAFSEDGERKTHVGGQALLEGVMMRGKYNWAVGVREPDGGVYEESHDLASGRAKNGWMYWPCVRGCRAMVESLVLGYKALEIAALHAFNEDEEDDADSASTQRAKATGSDWIAAKAAACELSGAEGAMVGVGDASLHPLAGDADARSAVRPNACDPDGEAPAPGPADATFSWKDDFGRPDTMIDALGAQRSLEVVSEPVPAPVASAAAASEPAAKSDGDAVFGKKEMAFSMVLGLVMGVVLFIVAPAFITNLLVGEYDAHTLAWNIVDGLLRVAVFVFYIWLIGRMSDIKRMFLNLPDLFSRRSDRQIDSRPGRRDARDLLRRVDKHVIAVIVAQNLNRLIILIAEILASPLAQPVAAGHALPVAILR